MCKAEQTTKIALAGLLTVHLLVLQVALVSGFSLFNRPHLFRNQQQQQQQAQQQVGNQQQREQIAMAANSLLPVYGNFGPGQTDLMRVRVAANRPQHFVPSYFGSDVSALETASHLAAPTLMAVEPPLPAPSSGYPNFQHEQSALDEAAPAVASQSSQSSGRIEPSQSEVVDKIERHIGRQVERTLDSHDRLHQMAEQVGQRVAAASGYQSEEKRAEKEPAASGEGHHGEEESHEEPHHPLEAEKRHHHEEEEEHHHHHHQEKHHKEPEEHHHHHEEHPPEAFEVHHKKGGKSFQYFHQGHHH